MNDRELLELAAKAAGLESIPCESVPLLDQEGEPYWNPLTHDGDALRLAVAVGLQMEIRLGVAAPNTIVWIAAPGEIVERHGDNPHAATRRAIVRAAAEIGKVI